MNKNEECAVGDFVEFEWGNIKYTGDILEIKGSKRPIVTVQLARDVIFTVGIESITEKRAKGRHVPSII